jgi:hypothetical protein
MNAALSISEMSMSQLQAAFLAIKRRIVRHAKVWFRSIICPHRRDDCIAEVVALCWKWFRSLARRGKDAREFVSVLADYAVRAVRSGRRICAQLKPNDVLSERAQAKRGFRVQSLPISTRRRFQNLYAAVGGQQQIDMLEEQLQHNTQTAIPDQVAFRCDFPEWLITQTHRDRCLIRDMARSERTLDLANKYKISQARVSQLRRDFYDDWERFTADLAETAPTTLAQ